MLLHVNVFETIPYVMFCGYLFEQGYNLDYKGMLSSTIEERGIC